ncbi:hypothetical protein ACFYO9_37460 [Streptomyces sp. NPDC005863]|uniref:hypothetical protein n=1 Tax=Streptomyces sp. NPDC005863 TaxID=3364735 RepID=UPI003685D419
MTVTWSEPCDLSDTDLLDTPDPAQPPSDIRQQGITAARWKTTETIDVTGEWL